MEILRVIFQLLAAFFSGLIPHYVVQMESPLWVPDDPRGTEKARGVKLPINN